MDKAISEVMTLSSNCFESDISFIEKQNKVNVLPHFMRCSDFIFNGINQYYHHGKVMRKELSPDNLLDFFCDQLSNYSETYRCSFTNAECYRIWNIVRTLAMKSQSFSCPIFSETPFLGETYKHVQKIFKSQVV